MERIVLLRETLGLSLQEMKDFLEVRRDVEALVPSLREPSAPAVRRESLTKVRALLVRQQTLMDAQMVKLQSARNEIEKLVERVDQGLKTLSQEP